jgi:hypothetical protein
MNNIIINRSKLIIDKLSGTMPVTNEEDKTRIIENMLREGGFQVRRGLYGIILTRMLDSEAVGYSVVDDKTKKTLLRIECDPRSPNNNFFRFEFNPSKINLSEFNELFTDITGMKFEHALEVSNLTRVDFAVDLTGISMNELAVTYGKHTTTRNILEKGITRYIGSEKANTQLCAYDKKEESKYANEQRMPELEEPTYHEKTRIELRLRRETVKKLNSMYELENPFENVSVYQVSSVNKLKEVSIQNILALLPYKGLHGVLTGVSPYYRRKVRDALEDCKLACWQPEEIWSELGGALRDLFDYTA